MFLCFRSAAARQVVVSHSTARHSAASYSAARHSVCPPFAAIIIWTWICGATHPAHANGGARPPATADQGGARVVKVGAIPNRHIEMPAGEGATDGRGRDNGAVNGPGALPTMVYVYGQNITDRLVSFLVSRGDAVVIVDPHTQRETEIASMVAPLARAGGAVDADPIRIDDPPLPSLQISGQISELWFETGERASRTFYGFKPGFENIFNDGASMVSRNEFAGMAPDVAFGDTGGLHFGKDIGSEINADVFWIGASLKRQRFEAAMGVVVRVQNLVSGRIEEHSLAVRGHGFYFQLSGVYLGYEAALALAKRNAMTQAFDRLTTAMAERVIGLLARAPLRARASVWQGAVYLPLGLWNRKMIVGEKFYNKSSYIRGGGAGLFEVDQVYERVCRLRVVGAGVGPAVETGDEFISLAPGEMPPATDDANKIGVGAASSFAPASIVTGSSAHSPSTTVFNLGDLDPDIRSAGFIEEAARRFLKGLEALITLPARLARFLQYDQGFRGVGGSRPLDERAIRHRAENDWALTQLGLPAAWAGGLGAPHVKVAVLDTGVDYNLDELRRSMAVIRHPVFGDGAGYDFFGGDNRAYDDHAHGTAAASLVLDVAPGIKIIPIKVFSSWGETTSAALYAGFDYALRAGARVILVPWGTEVNSVALKVGVERAARAGALVVTTSGDLGPGQGQVAVRYPAAFAKEDQNVRDSMLVGVGLDKQGQPLLQAGPLKLTSARADTIDFGAPAHGVQALKPRGGLGRNNRGSVYYNGAAAAYGAGVAALVWSNYPGLTAAEVRQAVLHGLAPGASGSYPRLRADGALEGAKRVAKR